MPEVASQPNTPQVVNKQAGFNWKSVLIAALIGVVVIGVATAGLRYYLNQSQSSLETGPVVIKSATPSAKTATSSAQKDETAGWKTYSNNRKGFKYEFKYPTDWNISVDTNTDDAETVDPTNEGYGSTTTLQLRSNDFDIVVPSPGYTKTGMNVYVNKPKELPIGKSIVDYANESFTSPKFTKVTISGYQAACSQYISTVNGEENINDTCYISDGKMITSISGTYLSKEKDKYKNTVKNISSTFKFL